MPKWISLVLSILATVAPPIGYVMSVVGTPASIVLLIILSPGILRELPYLLAIFLPLSLPVINLLYQPKKLPALASVLNITFFILWGLLTATFFYSSPIAMSYGYDTVRLTRELTFYLAVLTILTTLILGLKAAKKRKDEGGKFVTKPLKITLIVVGTICIAIATTFLVIDSGIRSKFNFAQNSIQDIEQRLILPKGGVKWDEDPMFSPKQDTFGDGLFDRYCWPTNPCQQVSRSWLVALEPGEEQEFIKTLTKESGFNFGPEQGDNCRLGSGENCHAYGGKDTWEIWIRFESLETAISYRVGADAPFKAEPPKALVDVNIKIFQKR